MDEVIVTDSPDPSPEESSAHEAAVHEGAAAVHHDSAEEAAGEAKQHAEAALSAVAANIDAATVAHESAERAEAAAEQSQVTLDMLHDALTAQGSAISALTDEIRNSRKPERQPATPPVEHKQDEAPRTPGKPKRRGFVIR